MPDPMTDYEIGAYRDAYNELRVAAESRRVEMMDEDATVSHEEASVRAALEAGATVVASLRATLAQRRKGVSACERCKGTGWAHEYFTSGPHSCGVRYVACGCGTRGAVIANEYTKASATKGVSEAMANTLHAAASDLRFVANGGVCERDTLLAHAHELLALAASGEGAA